MAWIESHQELGRHPKTKRLARALEISLPAAIGHLSFLWWWATDYAQNGDLTGYTNEDIADAAEWDGDADAFVEALVKARFIDRDEKGVCIHDWYDYAGRLIEQREYNKARMKKARSTRKQETQEHVQGTCAKDSEVNQKTQEHVQGTCAHGSRTVHARAENVRARFKENAEPCRATEPNLTEPNLTEPNTTIQNTTTTATTSVPPTSGGVEVAAAAVGVMLEFPKKSLSVPYKKIMHEYNTICTRLRKIKSIDGERKKAVNARFKSYGLESLIMLFEKANASEFLCGNGSKNWTADFDWLINAANMSKVLEGKYDNNQNTPKINPNGGADINGGHSSSDAENPYAVIESIQL